MSEYHASYYNLRVPHAGATLLFNGKTGALMRLDTELAEALGPLLGPERSRQAGTGYSDWHPEVFDSGSVPASVAKHWERLVQAGIFVEAQSDERQTLRSEYVNGKAESPFYVTVTTTLDCNMRCYYCYQKEDQLDHMSLETSDQISEWIKERIVKHGYQRMYLEWYGGEPMLNRPVIERISRSVIPFCDERGVKYKASMICNGTNWPRDVDRFLEETRMFRVQFSLDGPERFHNKRRGTINTDGSPGRNPSYDEVMRTVDSVIGKTLVYFRINVDPWVGRSCLEFIDVFLEKGWLKSKSFYPYIALINAMTEHCGFIEKHDTFNDFREEFTDIQKEFYRKLGQYTGGRMLEKAMYYPTRKLINCAAVSDHALVFGPNGLMYKCGLDVGDHFRSHDGLQGVAPTGASPEQGKAKPTSLKVLSTPSLDAERWNRYDPFTHQRCKECQYLPVCLGGCPKAQIERNEAQIKASSAFFEGQFDRMIREYYDSADRGRYVPNDAGRAAS